MAIFIQLASGGLGGNIAGALLGRFGLGGIGNAIVGIVGGGLAGQILWALGAWGRHASAGSLDLSAIFWSLAGGVFGGGILLLIIGGIRMIVGRATPA